MKIIDIFRYIYKGVTTSKHLTVGGFFRKIRAALRNWKRGTGQKGGITVIKGALETPLETLPSFLGGDPGLRGLMDQFTMESFIVQYNSNTEALINEFWHLLHASDLKYAVSRTGHFLSCAVAFKTKRLSLTMNYYLKLEENLQ